MGSYEANPLLRPPWPSQALYTEYNPQNFVAKTLLQRILVIILTEVVAVTAADPLLLRGSWSDL